MSWHICDHESMMGAHKLAVIAVVAGRGGGPANEK